MKQLYLGLALHNHQPVGNFPWVFEQAYERAYLPLLRALETHPAISLSLHYSGPLWDWLIAQHPDFLHRLAGLHARGQVELMTGGYYEPILPAIPDADKKGQISLMASFLKERFSAQPTGLWLAERVWEPYLAKPLAEAGVEWTLVDDQHFKMVGLEEAELLGYYLTEEQGYRLKIFPSLKRLRYLIPWKEVSEVIAFLQEQADESGTRIAVMGDDGEKFGIWPQTFEHCWEKGWMEAFFSALEQNSQWLHSIPLGEFARRFPPAGRVYIPCASYEEMLEWALPARKSCQFTRLKHQLEAEGRHEALSYMRGGYWRHFLVKYPEANWMHKKMLWVSGKVHRAAALRQALPDQGSGSSLRAESPQSGQGGQGDAQAAGDCGQGELWQGQCNCPYWHGVFGGLYLADIRAATYHHLIRAENRADQVLHGPHPWLHWEQADLDYDGHAEVAVETADQCLWLKPSLGGSLVEWDLRRPAHNLLSTLARRPEAYHLALQSETYRQSSPNQGQGVRSIHDGLRLRTEIPSTLAYDSQPRASLIDHFLPPDLGMDAFRSGQYPEWGGWGSAQYEVDIQPLPDQGSGSPLRTKRRSPQGGQGQALRQAQDIALRLSLSRDGHLPDGPPLRLEKAVTVALSGSSLEVAYTLTNIGQASGSGLLGSEWNFNLLAGGKNPQAYYRKAGGKPDYLDAVYEEKDIKEICLGNRHLNIELCLQTDPPARLWCFPVETISNSEAGLEKAYQASCLVLLYPFHLEPGATLHLRLSWIARSPIS